MLRAACAHDLELTWQPSHVQPHNERLALVLVPLLEHRTTSQVEMDGEVPGEIKGTLALFRVTL